MSAGIYIILNIANSKAYVGSTSSFEGRWRGHQDDLNKGAHHNRHLQRAWDKHGADAFAFIPIKVTSPTAALSIEQFYLDLCVGQEWCYNISPYASKPFTEMTDERRALLSEQAKSQWAEKRDKMVESLRGVKKKPRKPPEVTDEWRKSISEGKRGRKIAPRSEEHRRKLSEAAKKAHARRKEVSQSR